ncbi:MAG TPA: hypothetical protein VN132_10640 [Bdellovibrio sp.]|nr:hypothetical protein [Bdellovibrio sp.]
MKKIIVFLMLLAGNFARADANTIKYGRDLCEKVTFRNPARRACENWVIDNSDENVYSVALNICVGFNEGPSARSSSCFYRASQWIDNQEIKDQADLCVARNGNYNPRAECLQELFVRKNMEVTQASQQNQSQKAQEKKARAVR